MRVPVDITEQFMKDVDHDTKWVSEACAWLLNNGMITRYETGGKNDRKVIYFTNEEDAIVFKLKFGGV